MSDLAPAEDRPVVPTFGACVLGYRAVDRIERAARRYRVEAVPFADLEAASALYAQPLPDAVHEAADRPDKPGATEEAVRVSEPPRSSRVASAVPERADATEDDVDDPLLRSRPGALRARHAVLALAVVMVLVLLLIVLDHHPSGCRIVQASGDPGQTVDCSNAPPPGR